ncbi:MAG: transglycosylase SLT domain-containing protein [Acidobacteriota bacterium]
MSWTFALALALTAAGDDPRPEILRHRLEDRPDLARVRVERELQERPEVARELGLDYLLGVLLAAEGNDSAANQAFSRVLTATPPLSAHGRFRLAQAQADDDLPEVAAGLSATLLNGRVSTPRSLLPQALDLFTTTIENGGDCRLLAGIDDSRWSSPLQRRFTVLEALCARRAGREAEAGSMMADLVEAKRDDDIARKAVEWIIARPGWNGDPGSQLLVGLTLHQHAEHLRASFYLRQGLARAGHSPTRILGSSASESEARYALARARFRVGDYDGAAAQFEGIAQRTRVPRERARALYQMARSQELDAHWTSATATYLEAYRAEPQGSWADAALLSAMRLNWLSDREEEALELYQRLLSRPQWRGLAVRAALFLAASDLVQGRSDRADPWLDLAESDGAEARLEANYWRGRFFEIDGRPEDAVNRYLRALRIDRAHPISQAAAQRLRNEVGEEAQAKLRSLGISGGSQQQAIDAWILASILEDPATAIARSRALTTGWERNAGTAAYIQADLVDVAQWPLWTRTPAQPEDLLLGLGQFAEGQNSLKNHFPARDPDLLLTASWLLSRDGAHRASVRRAEILANAIPDVVPTAFYPQPLQRLLYPDPYPSLVVEHSARFRTDPNLLRAIMREESRFDPDAFSSASARGLTQFVLPTAQSLARKAGYGRLRPEHLYRPEISISLGAAYLDVLEEDLQSFLPAVVAAYNAGEDQAHLWKNYCFSRDPAEYYTKVGFRETRGYLRKVLSSRHHYLRIYGAPPPPTDVPRPPRSLAVAGWSP